MNVCVCVREREKRERAHSVLLQVQPECGQQSVQQRSKLITLQGHGLTAGVKDNQPQHTPHTHPKRCRTEVLQYECGSSNCPEGVIGGHVHEHLVLEVLQQLVHGAQRTSEGMVVD